jgi:hypothetical protein
MKQSFDSTISREAQRQGLQVKRFRSRHPSAPEDGGYVLTDPGTNGLVFPDSNSVSWKFGATAQEIYDFLKS